MIFRTGNRYLSHLEITLSSDLLWFQKSLGSGTCSRTWPDKNGQIKVVFFDHRKNFEIFYNWRCQDETCSRTCSCPNLRKAIWEKKSFSKFSSIFRKFEKEILKIFKILNNWARNWFSAKTFQKNDRTQKWPKNDWCCKTRNCWCFFVKNYKIIKVF